MEGIHPSSSSKSVEWGKVWVASIIVKIQQDLWSLGQWAAVDGVGPRGNLGPVFLLSLSFLPSLTLSSSLSPSFSSFSPFIPSPRPSCFSPSPSLLTLSLAEKMSRSQSLSRSRLFLTNSLSLSSPFLLFSSFLILFPPLTPTTGSWLPQNLYLACNCPDSNTEWPFCSKAQGHLAVISLCTGFWAPERGSSWLCLSSWAWPHCPRLLASLEVGPPQVRNTLSYSSVAGCVDRDGVSEKGFVGAREGGSHRIPLAQELCHRTPRINLYQGGDPKFASSYEWEVIVYRLFF